MNSASILADPAWLPHRYDEANDAFRFVYVPRGDHRDVTFLTDEYLANTGEYREIALADIDRAILPRGAIHFVFHSAYCCSTLVARMFDREGRSMGLKEPQVLNDLVGWRQRGAEPQKLAAVLDLALALLGRPFAQGEAVVVKPSNIVNGLAPAMLGLRPGAHALTLYAPIEDFLSSIAVKGLWGRQWVRKALISQARDQTLSHRFTTEELLELTDLQAAGLGWLSHHAGFARMRDRFGAQRVAICDSVTLLRDPAATVAAFYGHFGMEIAPAEAAAIAKGEAFTRNSKDRSDYSAERRRERLDTTLASNREEIEMVAAWVGALAEEAGIATTPAPNVGSLA